MKKMAVGLSFLLTLGAMASSCASTPPQDTVSVTSRGENGAFKSKESDNPVAEITNRITSVFSGSESETAVAILDFVRIDGRKSLLGRYLAEQMTTELFRGSKMKIVERGLIAQLTDEWEFSSSGMVSDDQMVEIGRTTGASSIVIGSMTKIGAKVALNVRIIEVETAAVLSTASSEFTGEEYLQMYDHVIE